MLRGRFDRTLMASVAGVWVAVAMSGCVNVAQQQGSQAGVAASGVPAASAALAASAPVGAASGVAAAGSQQMSLDGKPLALKKAPPLVYRVRRGDTLGRIAQHHHCSVKDLMAWNRLKPSTRLKLGQTLRVASPETVREVNAAAATAKAASAATATTAATSAPVVSAPGVAAANAGASTSSSVAGGASVSPAPDAAETRQVDAALTRHAKGVTLAWPAQGNVVQGFQPGETRGIEIGGKPGDPVRAAADGKVMYAGTGLNEYGSLIIVQHNKDFLTAYSHNRKLLVKTGDIVRQGQEIAEMGDENNSRVSVLFELRHDGKPIDPMPYLPGKQS
jgi:lipoprotein NlpD